MNEAFAVYRGEEKKSGSGLRGSFPRRQAAIFSGREKGIRGKNRREDRMEPEPSSPPGTALLTGKIFETGYPLPENANGGNVLREMTHFLYYYLRSMRLYYAFVTGSTVLAGVFAAYALLPGETEERLFSFFPGPRGLLAAGIGFLSWGVNQIFNDFGNREEDAVNAPNRPMVNGRLAALPALLLSSVMMLFCGVAVSLASPWALLPVAGGVLLNLLYNSMKRIPVAGCAVYGLSVSMCYLFGFSAVPGRFTGGTADGAAAGAGVADAFFSGRSLAVWLLCILLHGMMCFFSGFKDMEGDRAAGIRSVQVISGYRKALLWGMILEGMILLLFGISAASGIFFPWGTGNAGGYRMGVGEWAVTGAFLLTAFMGIRLLILLKHRKMHEATCANCQSCVAQILLLGALGTQTDAEKIPLLAAMPLFLLMIQVLFRWYRDEKE